MAKVKKPVAVVPGIWEWDQERVIEEVLPSGAEIRLTVGWLSGYQMAQYRVLYQETILYAMEKHGVTPSELVEGEDGLSPITTEVQSWWERAFMFSALRKVEVKAGEEWHVTEFPPAWREIETFRYSVPDNLYAQWRAATMDLNPQIFSARQSEPEKKDEPPAETM